MRIFRAVGFVFVLISLKLLFSDVFGELESMVMTIFNVIEVALVSVIQTPFFKF